MLAHADAYRELSSSLAIEDLAMPVVFGANRSSLGGHDRIHPSGEAPSGRQRSYRASRTVGDNRSSASRRSESSACIDLSDASSTSSCVQARSGWSRTFATA